MSLGVWSAFLSALNLIAMLMVSRSPSKGWLAMLALQALWTPYDIVTGQYGFLLTSGVLSVIAFRAWRDYR